MFMGTIHAAAETYIPGKLMCMDGSQKHTYLESMGMYVSEKHAYLKIIGMYVCLGS